MGQSKKENERVTAHSQSKSLTRDKAALKELLMNVGRTQEAKDKARKSLGIRGNFAIALDATGSMEELIADAKASIGEIINRVFKEASTKVNIQFFVYRDYDVPREVLEFSPLSADSQELIRWLDAVRAFGGGANVGEAVNEALQAIAAANVFDGAIVAGDEPSLPHEHLRSIGKNQSMSAIELAEQFGKRGIPIHTFLVGARKDTENDFKVIAEKSGGRAGRLDGSAAMIDMAVMAILERVKGAAAVNRYMNEHQLTHSAKQFGNLLLAPPPK